MVRPTLGGEDGCGFCYFDKNMSLQHAKYTPIRMRNKHTKLESVQTKTMNVPNRPADIIVYMSNNSPT